MLSIESLDKRGFIVFLFFQNLKIKLFTPPAFCFVCCVSQLMDPIPSQHSKIRFNPNRATRFVMALFGLNRPEPIHRRITTRVRKMIPAARRREVRIQEFNEAIIS